MRYKVGNSLLWRLNKTEMDLPHKAGIRKDQPPMRAPLATID